jgi:hypothetical protein
VTTLEPLGLSADIMRVISVDLVKPNGAGSQFGSLKIVPYTGVAYATLLFQVPRSLHETLTRIAYGGIREDLMEVPEGQ